MKKSIILLLINVIAVNFAFSQGAAVNTTGAPADNSAMLDISGQGKGLLIPRMTTANRPANPVEALLIYNTETQCFEAYNAKTAQWVNVKCMTSPCPVSIVTDYDGNNYNTVAIGAQCWFKENLNVTHYRNGDNIPNVTDNNQWANLTTGAYCNLHNDINNAMIYGRLYNWYAVDDNRKLCPTGWHVPSDAEWQTLVVYLGDSLVAGGKMKEAGTVHWQSPNTGATNESGFTALSTGRRGYNGGGTFSNLGNLTLYWSTTIYTDEYSWSRGLRWDTTIIYRMAPEKKTDGFSVRCLKD